MDATHSRRRTMGRGARILACLLSAYGILLLVDTRVENDAVGYFLLVVGPLVMLGARWIDGAGTSAETEVPDANADQKATDAADQEAPSQVVSEEPR